MLDATNATMVEQQAIPQGCRTRCGTCLQPIEEVPPPFPTLEPTWRHVEGYGGDWHEATPVAPEPPEFTRQALTHPSSLVDFLLESARFHGVPVVTSAETYRAAERFAAGLLQTLTEGGVR